MALAVVDDDDRDGLVGRVVGDAVDGLALVGLGNGPLVGSGRGEGHLAEALGVVGAVLFDGHRRIRERRGGADRSDRELEGVVRRPVTAGQGLLDLGLAFAGDGVVVGERRRGHVRRVVGGDFDFHAVGAHQLHVGGDRLRDGVGAGDQVVYLDFVADAVGDGDRLCGRVAVRACDRERVRAVRGGARRGFSVHRHVLRDLQAPDRRLVVGELRRGDARRVVRGDLDRLAR